MLAAPESWSKYTTNKGHLMPLHKKVSVSTQDHEAIVGIHWSIEEHKEKKLTIKVFEQFQF